MLEEVKETKFKFPPSFLIKSEGLFLASIIMCEMKYELQFWSCFYCN